MNNSIKTPPEAHRVISPNPPLPGTSVNGTGAVDDHAFIMAESAQFWPEFTLTSGGVPFILGVDRGGIIRYLDTHDERFATPEGIHAGMTYQSVKSLGQAIREGGWAYYVQLPSGWNAAFIVGGSTQGELTDEVKVANLFRRIGYGDPAKYR